MEEHPDEKKWAIQYDNAVERLKVAREKEVACGADPLADNPLEGARQLMALSEEEMDRWVRVFRRFDVQEEGSFLLDDFFLSVEVLPNNDFARDLFTSLGATDEEGRVEFGDFLKVMSTFCLFGLEEVLKSLFIFCDATRAGFVTASQYMKLVDTLSGARGSPRCGSSRPPPTQRSP